MNFYILELWICCLNVPKVVKFHFLSLEIHPEAWYPIQIICLGRLQSMQQNKNLRNCPLSENYHFYFIFPGVLVFH